MSTIGKQLKLRGMNYAAVKRSADLEEARAYLVKLAISRANREVSADDVYYYKLGNAAGSLFRTEEWEFTGKWVQSAVPERHCGMIRVWKLK